MEKIASSVSVADRLAAKLKESDFGDLMDEESLNRIAQDAIERAFFQPRLSGPEYNRHHKDPLIVEMARDTFQAAIEKRAEAIAAEIVKSDDFIEALTKAAIFAIPGAIERSSYMLVTGAVQQSVNANNDLLSNVLTLKLRQIRDNGGL